MDSTTHTTTTVEFVDWRAKAKAKLEAEDNLFKGGRAAKSVQSYVLRTLLGFVDQEPRFAEVVASMYELTYVYNLDEMLKLYDLIMMQRDIEYAKSQEDRRGNT